MWNSSCASKDYRRRLLQTRTNGVWTEQQKLLAPNAAQGDGFGFSVAIEGDTAMVGAPGRDSSGITNHGVAYVFTRVGSTWSLHQQLVTPALVQNNELGRSVAFLGDRALVGSLGTFSGEAHAFTRFGSTWTYQQKLTAPDAAQNDWFGHAVALSPDTAVIGTYVFATKIGKAYVFGLSGGSWVYTQQLVANNAVVGDRFGASVAISGDIALVGSYTANPTPGAVWSFLRNGATWVQDVTLTANDGAAGDHFGVSVAMSQDTLWWAPWTTTSGPIPTRVRCTHSVLRRVRWQTAPFALRRRSV